MLNNVIKQILICKKKDWVILKYLQWCNLWYLIRTNIWSQQLYFIIQLNFRDFIPYNLKRKPDGELAKLTREDIQSIIQDIKRIKGDERRELLGRIRFSFHNVPQGYCIKKDGSIRYIQWLIEPRHKEVLYRCYPKRMQKLNAKQVVLENAYTFPECRGMGYYYYVTSELLKKARQNGYKFAIGYVRADKIASFNTMLRMGFKITHVQQERKCLGLVRRSIRKSAII